MSRADRYSRLVVWLKVALPLAALAILATLFLVAERLDPEAAIPYAEVDVERILREQGITGPSYGGVTSDGVAVSLSAATIRPIEGDARKFVGFDLEAELILPDGGTIDIVSPEGQVDGDTREAILQGGARLESSSGYTVTTDRIVTSMIEARAESDDTVVATGPAGEITAGRMILERRDGEAPGYLLVFKDGVRLIYDPQP